MKKIGITLILSMILLNSYSQSFEGTMSFQSVWKHKEKSVKGYGLDTTIANITFKGNCTREKRMTTINNMAFVLNNIETSTRNDTVYMIDHKNKTIEMRINKKINLYTDAEQFNKLNKKTSETKKINDYDCVLYTREEQSGSGTEIINQKYNIWICQNIKTSRTINSITIKGVGVIIEDHTIFTGNLDELLMDYIGKILSVNPMKIPDSEFSLPVDYQMLK